MYRMRLSSFFIVAPAQRARNESFLSSHRIAWISEARMACEKGGVKSTSCLRDVGSKDP